MTPPLLTEMPMVLPVSVRVLQLSRLLFTGMMVFTNSAFRYTSGLNTTCSFTPGSVMYQPYCGVAAHPGRPGQHTGLLVSSNTVLATGVRVCCSRLARPTEAGPGDRLAYCTAEAEFHAVMFQSQMPYRLCVPPT